MQREMTATTVAFVSGVQSAIVINFYRRWFQYLQTGFDFFAQTHVGKVFLNGLTVT